MVLAGVTERQQQLSLVQHLGWSGTDGGLGRPVRAQTTAETCPGGSQRQVRPGRRADGALLEQRDRGVAAAPGGSQERQPGAADLKL